MHSKVYLKLNKINQVCISELSCSESIVRSTKYFYIEQGVWIFPPVTYRDIALRRDLCRVSNRRKLNGIRNINISNLAEKIPNISDTFIL